MTRTIVWFRDKDLRLSDHEPLRTALGGGEVIPLFVLELPLGRPNRTAFVIESLEALSREIHERGSRLVLVSGKAEEVVPRLANEWKAERVVAQRAVEPLARARDARVKQALGERFVLCNGETLVAPGTVRNKTGAPYSVYTPFARRVRESLVVEKPLPAPRSLPALPRDVVRALRGSPAKTPTLAELGIAPSDGILQGGERAASGRLRQFVRAKVSGYHERRDRLDLDGTSRLSADLACGTISVRKVFCAVEDAHAGKAGASAFVNELFWREFAYANLFDRPELLETPFREAWTGFPYRYDEEAWHAWMIGKTGYPVVDASARQLLEEGFVHNRARMISASFLTKHLLIDYRRGEAHFMQYLTDGDAANNNMGWQWSAGSGVDAQPHFRIFNPVIQGERFDPHGDYVRRYVPELAGLPARVIHRPWEASEAVLRAAGVRLGVDYPLPIVDHRAATERFLRVAAKHLGRG